MVNDIKWSGIKTRRVGEVVEFLSVTECL